MKKGLLEQLTDQYLASATKVAQAHLDAGIPITYRDEYGHLVKEYPCGYIEVIEAAISASS